MKDEQKRQIIALRRDGAGYRSHGGFSYRLLVCQKFFLLFLEKTSEKAFSQGYRVEGKTILTLRKEEKP